MRVHREHSSSPENSGMLIGVLHDTRARSQRGTKLPYSGRQVGRSSGYRLMRAAGGRAIVLILEECAEIGFRQTIKVYISQMDLQIGSTRRLTRRLTALYARRTKSDF